MSVDRKGRDKVLVYVHNCIDCGSMTNINVVELNIFKIAKEGCISLRNNVSGNPSLAIKVDKGLVRNSK
ncbi:hypothetical protein KQX54_004998 [Cotesia glomerata]|uniref:Uncharacterized protein n=1 Tax=Cotesia glomerata TaxID=32391 RepID=A0AAV7IUI1_COTGL|nr:hypothetical protein KQX54_004998 [Cotesia glomerata]